MSGPRPSASSAPSSGGMDQILAEALAMDAHELDSASLLLSSTDLSGIGLDTSLFQELPMLPSSIPPFDAFPMPFLPKPPSSTFRLGMSGAGAPGQILLGKPVPEHLQRTKEQVGIASWVNDPIQAGGYTEGHDCNLLATIQNSTMQKPIKPHLLTDKLRKNELPLSRAALDPNGSNVIVVGTANRNAKKHMVTAIDTTLLLKSSYCDADSVLVGMATCRSHVQELHWVGERTLVVAHGADADATVFRIDDQFSIGEQCGLRWVHTSEIREMSFNPTDPSRFAAGGFDQILSINDLNLSGAGITIGGVRLDEVIGSVRWNSFDPSAVSITCDDGRFFQFDSRADMRKAAIFADAQKLHLYTHVVFSPNLVLLGFGDGEILQVDLRKSMFIAGTRDPFIHSIGDVMYDQYSSVFLFSGQSDFSLWLYDANTATAQAWSHCSTTYGLPEYSHAIFARDPQSVIKTDELGVIGLYQHRINK